MTKRSILIVDDEEDILLVLQERFSVEGYDVSIAKNGEDALSQLNLKIPDLILLDLMMDGMDGMEVKKRLNQEERTADIPIIFLTANALTENKVMSFKLGGDDYVTKPFEFNELLARVNALSERRKLYDQKLLIDELTGLNNTRMYEKRMKELFNLAKACKKVFAIIIMDLDKFKKINDDYGHYAGNLVLKHVADVMKKVFREQDILIRYGGDEFVIVLPDTNLREAKKIAGSFKAEILNQLIIQDENHREKKLHVSVSMGVAVYHSTIKNEIELFKLADQAMYQDKKRKKFLK